jgi:hypothetical protein
MTSRMRQQQSDGFLTIRNAWMVGKTLTPSDPVSIFETNINNLLGAALLFPAAALLLGAQRALEKRVSPEDKRTNLA